MDSSFYPEFFAEMLPKVQRFVGARFKGPLVEDIASETLLTIWRKNIAVPVSSVEVRQLRQLTYRVAVGHILNAERKHARESGLLADVSLRILPGEDPTYEAVLPLDLAQDVAALERGDRQAVNLLLAGFETAEIADILGIKAKAASMRLARARARLHRRREAAEAEEGNDRAR